MIHTKVLMAARSGLNLLIAPKAISRPSTQAVAKVTVKSFRHSRKPFIRLSVTPMSVMVSSPDTSVKTSGMPVWGKILITVLTFPIWIGPVSAAFGITVALIAVSVGFLLGGAGGLVFGIVISFRNLASGLLFSGAGILLVGLGGLCGVGTFYICKYEGIGVGKLCRLIFTNGGARK